MYGAMVILWAFTADNLLFRPFVAEGRINVG